MARLLLLLVPLLLCSQALRAGEPDPPFLPAEGERTATVLYAGDDPTAGPLLARLGYDCFVARPELEELAALAARAREHAGAPPVLVTRGPGTARAAELPVTEDLAGWVSLGPALPEGTTPPVPFLLLEGNVQALGVANDPLQKSLRNFVAHRCPRPPVGLPGVKFVASPNWTVRPPGAAVEAVVLHSTVVDTLEGTEEIFLDPGGREVSAHYVVDRDGTIVQMVDERYAAHHAGVSELEGRTRLNEFSLGIEMVNRNDGVDPYPEPQRRAVAAILRDLRTRWTVPDSRIVSHAQVARPVGRKSDPVGFDFQELYRWLEAGP